MKKIFLFTVCLLSVCCKAQMSFSYALRGKLGSADFDGTAIAIQRYDNHLIIDTITVVGDEFVYHGVADSAMYCRIEGAGTYANFIIEEGEINVDMLTHSYPSGTPLNEGYAQMKRAEERLSAGLDSMRQSIIHDNKLSREERIRRQNELDDIKTLGGMKCRMLRPFVLQNSNNELGVAACQAYLIWASPDCLDSLQPHLGEWILSRQQIKKQIALINKARRMEPGNPFIDFEAEDLEGNKVALSDYVGRGKYVLVDFSASWCVPCLAELPNLSDVYERFKGERFDVVTVAVWDKPDNSLKMFKDHGINWPGMINAGVAPMELYGFSAIPRIILFAPDGTIVDNQLRGPQIGEKVAEVLGIR